MFLGRLAEFLTARWARAVGGRTGLREILPVECYEFEDLRESTEGFTPQVVAPRHPLARKARLATMPPILGYNRVKPRKGF